MVSHRIAARNAFATRAQEAERELNDAVMNGAMRSVPSPRHCAASSEACGAALVKRIAPLLPALRHILTKD